MRSIIAVSMLFIILLSPGNGLLMNSYNSGGISHSMHFERIDPDIFKTRKTSAQVIVVAESHECLKKINKYIINKENIIKSFKIIPAILIEANLTTIYDIASIPCIKYIILNNKNINIHMGLEPRQLRVPHLTNRSPIENWAIHAVEADKAWRIGYRGEGIRIGIIDTGININHPALKYKLFTMIPNDPYYPGGWIEISETGYLRCTIPRDDNGHGTFVASQIAGGDGVNITLGIAPRAQLMVAKAFDAEGSATPAQVLAAFEWMSDPTYCNGTSTGVKPNIVVFSAGFTGYKGVLLLDIIRKLLEDNIIVVAAIGNNGPGISDYPGNVWGVFGIGAINEHMQVPWFSSGENITWANPPEEWPFKPPYPLNYLKPDFVAPGVNVIGATLEGGYAMGNGTSYSTGVAAGTVALLLQALKAYNHTSPIPSKILPEIVYEILANTSIDVGDPGQDIRAGYGLIQAYSAILLARNLTMYYNLSMLINSTRVHVGDSIVINISVEDPYPSQPIPLLIYLDDEVITETQLETKETTILLSIPNTTMGTHTITAITPDGKYRGSSQIIIEPSLSITPSICWPGTSITIRGYGLEANHSYLVDIDGEPLQSKLYTNNKGFGVTAASVPDEVGTGTHYIMLIDPINNQLIIQAPVDIISEPNYELLIAQQPIYESNQIVFYIYTLLNDTPIRSNITIEPLSPENAIKEFHVEEIKTGLYKIILTINNNITTVLIMIQSKTYFENIEFNKYKLLLITIDYTTSQILNNVKSLWDEITILSGKLNKTNMLLQKLAEGYNSMTNEIAEINQTVIEDLNIVIYDMDMIKTKLEKIIMLLNNNITNIRTEIENVTDTINNINYNIVDIKKNQRNQDKNLKEVKENLDNLQVRISSLRLLVYILLFTNILTLITAFLLHRLR